MLWWEAFDPLIVISPPFWLPYATPPFFFWGGWGNHGFFAPKAGQADNPLTSCNQPLLLGVVVDIWQYDLIHMDVSKNRCFPPKSSILIGFSIINHPFWRYLYFWKHPFVHPTNYVLFFWLKLFICIYVYIYIYVYSFLKSSSQLVGRMSSKSIIADATETWWTQNRLLKRQRKVSCSTYILYYIGDAPHIWYWWYRNTNCKIPLQNAALVVATCAGFFCCLLKLSGIALAETSDVNKNLLTLQGGFRWMFPKIVVPPNHPF